MKNYLKIMLSAIMLLVATQGYGIVKYDDWSVSNPQPGTSSAHTWRVDLKVGEMLRFYYQSSGDDESRLVISINGNDVVNKYYYASGHYVYTATDNISLKIVAKYLKGYSVEDSYALIDDMYVYSPEDQNQTHDVRDIVVGESFRLGSQFDDSFPGLSYCAFTWTSSDNNVVKVTDNCGEIEAIGSGTATVTATYMLDDMQNMRMTQTFNIRVVEVLDVPGYLKLDKYNNSSYSWSSGDESIAIVGRYGEVIGLKEGTTTITRTYRWGDITTYPIRVTKVGIDINGSMSLRNIFYGSKGFYASSWTSADESIAKVTKYGYDSDKGEVYGFSVGSTTITATGTKDGEEVSMTFPVNVKNEGIYVSHSFGLSRVFYALTGKDLSSWSIADENIARIPLSSYYDNNTHSTILQKGNVYGLLLGSTTITAKSGDVSIDFPVKVTEVCTMPLKTMRSDIASLFKAFTGVSVVNLSVDENMAFVIKTKDGFRVLGLKSGETPITATDGMGRDITLNLKISDPFIKDEGDISINTFGFDECEVWVSPNDEGESAWTNNYDVKIESDKEETDEYGNTNKTLGFLFYRFTFPEKRYKSFSPDIYCDYEGDNSTCSYRIYVDEDLIRGNEPYVNEKAYLTPGTHTMFIEASVTGRGSVTIPGSYYGSIYTEPDYSMDTAGVPVDTICLSSEGTLGGEALKIHDNLSEFKGLCVSGPFDSYDWKTLAEMNNLEVLDMTGVVADSYPKGSQNSKIKAVKLSKHIECINNTPFYSALYTYVPDEVRQIEKINLSSGDGSSSKLLCLDGCKGVKILGPKVFSGRYLPEYLDFPSVEEVGDSAFYGSIFLKRISLPSAINIGTRAFANTSLKEVNLPVTEKIDLAAFVNTSLAEVSLPAAKEIGYSAFESLSLFAISLPSVETIKSGAFCNTLLSSIDLPEATTIEAYAFRNCPLLSVRMPKVKVIGKGAFAYSNYVSSNWSHSAYYNYGDNGIIEDIDITLAEDIEDYAFYGNKKLVSVKAERLRNIGDNAFRNCMNLKTIDLSKAESIGNGSFWMVTDYYSNLNGQLDNIDLSHVTNMGGRAFQGCRNLKSVNISNLKVIPDSAFYSCSALQSVDARRATTIGSSAFSGCSSLATVNLSKAEEIGDYAFSGCKLQEINLPNVTNLGTSAFSNNKAATSIELSDKLTAIGSAAFYGCTAVEHLTLPASLTELPTNCFSGSNNIKTISVNAPAPPAVGETPFTMQTLYTATLRVPSASMALYQAHDYWKHFYYWEENEAQLTDLVLATSLNMGDIRMDKTNLTINPGISLTMGGNEAQAFRNVLLKSTGSQTGMLLSNCERITSDQTSVELSMTGLKWYFISLPFDVTISDIQNSEGAQLAIHRYDGATRASQGTGSSWVRQRTGTLSRGKGYIIQASKATTLTLPATYETKDVPFLPYDVTFTLEENASQTAANQGWNFVGNPYPTYFDIAQLGYSAPITVWTGSTYAAYSPEDDDLALAPLQPFFVQRPSGVESLTLNAQGRQTTSVISHPTEVKAMQPQANRRQLLDVVLTDGEQTDRTRIVCNALATDGYDLSCDAAKMMSMEADVPQLYTHRNGVEYAINEGPQEGGDVELGLLLPKTGTYTLRLQRADMRAMLTDLLTGETFELTADGYTFEAEAGTCDDRFVLTLLTDEETAVEDIESEMVNGKWSNGEWYDLSGRRFNKASRGVNIVRQGTNVTKQLSR